jgi:hypothetical protein
MYPFFELFGYSRNLVNYIFSFLFNLKINLKKINLNGTDANSIFKIPRNIDNRFLFIFITLDIDISNIELLKSIFENARKQGLYLYLNIGNLEYIFPERRFLPDAVHGMYAIPVNDERFILKNSWDDIDTDIIIKFNDLLYQNCNISLIYFYFNNNKLDKIPSSELKRIPIRNHILRTNKRSSLRKIKSLSLTKKNKSKYNRKNTL